MLQSLFIVNKKLKIIYNQNPILKSNRDKNCIFIFSF